MNGWVDYGDGVLRSINIRLVKQTRELGGHARLHALISILTI